MKLKILIALMVGSLFIGALSGCAESGLRPHESEQASEQPDATPDGSETSELKDYTYAYEKYEADEVVLTINGLPVLWDEYFYWLYGMVEQIELYFGDVTDWDSVSPIDENMTLRELVEEEAMTNMRSLRMVESKAIEMGVELSDADIEELNSEWEKEIETYGGEEAFETFLKTYYLNTAIYRKIGETNRIYLKLFEEMFGNKGINYPDEDVLEYIDNHNIIGTKHILFLKTEESAESAEDTENAEDAANNEEILALAEDVLGRLGEAEDLEALFDELMNEYSEDPGLASAPGGYFFSDEDSIYPEYREAMEKLAIGEYSGIVESTSGYHIILRIPVEPDSVAYYTNEEDKQTIRMIASLASFDALVSGWMEESVPVYTDKFKGITLEDIFDK